MVLSIFSLSALLIPLNPVRADPGQPAEEPGSPSSRPSISYLVHFQYGWAVQIISAIKHSNFQTATLSFSLEKEYGSLLIPKKYRFVESLLVEFRLSKIWGKNIPLMDDEVTPQEAEQARKEGRGPSADWDVYQVGVAPFYRLYYPLSSKTRPYFEIGAGFTWLSEPLITDGTNWNFSLYAGLGIEQEIYKIPFYVVLRFEHFSNGEKLWGEFGYQKGNIGVEWVALGVGIRFR